MQSCARCTNPIPNGEEVWVQRKSTNQRVPLCSDCAKTLHANRSTQKKQPARTVPANQTPEVKTSPTHTGTVSLDSILILILVVMVAAPILGGLLALVGSAFYLIFLFPIGMGLLNGFIVSQGVRWGKLREPVVAGVFALLFGLTVYGAYRYVDYQLIRREIRSAIVEGLMFEFGEADPAEVDFILDEFLYAETGQTGFIGVVLLDAKAGMSVGRVGRSTTINIGTTLTWVYWLFEASMIVGIPIFLAMAEAKRPFCEFHDRWYSSEKSLGGIATGHIKETLNLLDTGQYESFGKTLNARSPGSGVEIFIQQCPDCQQSSPNLIIKRVQRTSKGKKDYTVLSQRTITPEQGEQLVAGTKQTPQNA